MPDLAKLVDDLSTLTVIEAAELSKMLEEKWGVSAAAPVAVAALAGGAAAPAAEAAAEKTEFDVILAAIGEKKINVIKEVRAITRGKPSGAKGTYIKKVSLSSSMGPGVKVELPGLAEEARP